MDVLKIKYLAMEFLGCKKSACLVLCENVKLSCMWLNHFTFVLAVYESSGCSIPFPTLFHCINLSHSNGYTVILMLSLIAFPL